MGASCSSLFSSADIFAFNESLTFVAPLAETQISTVVIVRRADGTRCAYKTICFAKERREKGRWARVAGRVGGDALGDLAQLASRYLERWRRARVS